MSRIYQRIKCIFTGHSHPALDCFRCGARSPWQFKRKKNGELVLDKNGNVIWQWVGWGW